MSMLRRGLVLLLIAAVGLASVTTLVLVRRKAPPETSTQMPPQAAVERLCETMPSAGGDIIVCRINLDRYDLRLALRNEQGTVFGGFDRLSNWMADRGERLDLAMNAGMYHEDRSPVGLYVEAGRELSPASTTDGQGNFHLKPNGIFSITAGRARVEETGAYLAAGRRPDVATQSGPMLVIDGALHPRFQEGSTSKNIRNGVCALDEGRSVVLAISKRELNFHDFARFFRDDLGCRNALYFDGYVSSLYAPGEGIRIEQTRLGPLLVVTRRNASGSIHDRSSSGINPD